LFKNKSAEIFETFTGSKTDRDGFRILPLRGAESQDRGSGGQRRSHGLTVTAA
jgi:hypothetical protein